MGRGRAGFLSLYSHSDGVNPSLRVICPRPLPRLPAERNVFPKTQSRANGKQIQLCLVWLAKQNKRLLLVTKLVFDFLIDQGRVDSVWKTGASPPV